MEREGEVDFVDELLLPLERLEPLEREGELLKDPPPLRPPLLLAKASLLVLLHFVKFWFGWGILTLLIKAKDRSVADKNLKFILDNIVIDP